MSRSLAKTVTPFLAMTVLEKALEMERVGHRVIHLSVGQPDFPTPDCALEAAKKAMADGHTGYTHSLGIWPLREAVAEYYHKEYGVKVSPEQIIITGGSSPAMLMLFDALCETGDEVITGNPGYACYTSFIRHSGGKAVEVPVREEDGFQMSPDKVRTAISHKTRGILVNSPSNPAGTIMSRDDMANLAALCTPESGIMLVSDEIYHGLCYEGRATSALELTENACVLDGFSKRYAMTGWRLGWMVVPKSFIPLLTALQQNFFICAGSVAQWTGLAALKGAEADVKRMAAEYNRRRLIMVERLGALGFGIKSAPNGAFYVLADARHLGAESQPLAMEILEKAHVGVTPGIDFGSGAEGYLRFSYANSIENIEEAMARIRKFMENR